jgi:hypothetical protein
MLGVVHARGAGVLSRLEPVNDLGLVTSGGRNGCGHPGPDSAGDPRPHQRHPDHAAGHRAARDTLGQRDHAELLQEDHGRKTAQQSAEAESRPQLETRTAAPNRQFP